MRSRRSLTVAAIGFEAALAAAAWAWAAAADLALGPLLRPAPWQLVAGCVGTLPLLAMLRVALLSRRPWWERLRRLVDETLGDWTRAASWGELAALAVAAGFGEELLFRGVAQPLVQRWAGTAVALVAVSLVFGALHAVSCMYFLLATLVGAYLGALAIACDSLWPAILAHALYDFAALVALRRRAGRLAAADGEPSR
jgi:membrane protease YdiL (CAAX protease family)